MTDTPRLPPSPYATVYRPNGALSIYGLHQGRNAIGRHEDCEVQVDDPLASRHHADLTIEGAVGVVVDRDSTNGLEVNGVRCERARVAHGDVLTVGASEIKLQLGRSTKVQYAPLPGDLGLYAAALVSCYRGPDAGPGTASVEAITAYVRETGLVRNVSDSTTQRRLRELADVIGAPEQLRGRGRASRLWPWMAEELGRRGF